MFINACCTCSTLIFPHSTNQILNLWSPRCRCRPRCYGSLLSTKRKVKMAGYWPSSLFAFLWTGTKSRSVDAKRERGQYAAILTKLAWSIKDLSYGIKSKEKMIFVLVYFRALRRKPVICKIYNLLRFSRFLVPSRQKNRRKYFYCHGKYFAKEKFRAPAWTSAKCYCGSKTGIPELAVSLHLARSDSQPQCGIWFILPAHGACHIIRFIAPAGFWPRRPKPEEAP